MKVNFWQVLGLVLIIVGVVLFARGKIGKDTVQPAAPSGPAATAPAVP